MQWWQAVFLSPFFVQKTILIMSSFFKRNKNFSFFWTKYLSHTECEMWKPVKVSWWSQSCGLSLLFYLQFEMEKGQNIFWKCIICMYCCHIYFVLWCNDVMKNILIWVRFTVYITHELTSKVLVPWDKILTWTIVLLSEL